MDGFGVFQYSNGNRYEGEFANGIMNGNGKFEWKDGSKFDGAVYDGEWKNGKRNGMGMSSVGEIFRESACIAKLVCKIPFFTIFLQANTRPRMVPLRKDTTLTTFIWELTTIPLGSKTRSKVCKFLKKTL